MAEDRRYSWLDDSAAERLLRGEPVEGQHGVPSDRHDQSCAEAERLAAVLSAVAEATRPAAGPTDGAPPLPGEEAAVSAFVSAREEFAAAAADDPMPGSEASGGGGRVVRALRGGRFGARRQLRAGMVAALAGCALSGFAVAAGAGVLPTPFGERGGSPSPSVSMPGDPATDSVHPEISRDPTTATPGPSGSGDNDASDPSSNGGSGPTAPNAKDKGHGKGGGKGEKDHSAGSPGSGRHGGTWALDACRRYLAAESGEGSGLDRKALHQLKKSAGRSTLHGYCVQILSNNGAQLPSTGSDGKGDGGTDGGGDDSGGSGGSGGSDDGGSGGSGEDGSGGSGDGGRSGDPNPEPPPPTPSAPAETPADGTATTGSTAQDGTAAATGATAG
ncbi:hypothetical protein HUT19_24145 [Streptomyces sp. NA02950]|uniref:hypothetical protein n=1 Tax=Streptomyces sp. NA02950 TaxID=2742137 RepID=UPI0015908695|nr:hypothetical protein [Streptomyces sp. NA02950]QKV94466.1 hypothetical protein HUT19_24145 [Streptomyces sp. NA02950]